MDRETWDALVGRLKEALVHRRKDPGEFLRTDREEQEIRIWDDREDPPRPVEFHMDSEYEEQAPRILAERMVEEALGSE